jgi:hypothetical protein
VAPRFTPSTTGLTSLPSCHEKTRPETGFRAVYLCDRMCSPSRFPMKARQDHPWARDQEGGHGGGRVAGGEAAGLPDSRGSMANRMTVEAQRAGVLVSPNAWVPACIAPAPVARNYAGLGNRHEDMRPASPRGASSRAPRCNGKPSRGPTYGPSRTQLLVASTGGDRPHFHFAGDPACRGASRGGKDNQMIKLRAWPEAPSRFR